MCKRTSLTTASASNGKSRNDDDNNSKEDSPLSTTTPATTATTTTSQEPHTRDAPVGTVGSGGGGRRRRRIPAQKRRSKRDREWTPVLRHERTSRTSARTHHPRGSGVAGGGGKKGGGVEALLPSAIAVVVMGFAAMARMGFRGRIEVAGIDLGTTNSVICVQALSSSVGEIDCIEDPANGSPLVPSVVSFLHRDEVSSYRRGGSDSNNAAAATSPSLHGDVLVGHRAKQRIDMHPHSTFYHAKRFLGRPFNSDAVSDLRVEVEFDVVKADSLVSKSESTTLTDEMMPLVQNNEEGVFFHVPGGYSPADSSSAKGKRESPSSSTSSSLRYHISPEGIGSYVVRHLLYLASLHLGYDNIKSAVIAVPAKFDSVQRQATAIAFKNAGIRVARMLEEPTAEALAYGLHRKPNVNHILVYDFGGGTLDVSVLHVSDGFVDVMASEGDDTLGGADFDSAVAKFLMVGGEADGEAAGQVRRVAEALDALAATEAAAGGADNEHKDGASEEVDEGGGGTVDLLDAVEERLAETCDVLEVTPLCHVSSFHTVAEKMKISLSSDDDTEYVEEECLGLPEPQGGGGKVWTFESFCSALKPVKLSLTQNEFDQSVSHLYNRSLLPIRRVLRELDLEAEDIDEVVMVGGSTRLPMIRKLVREELRVKALNTHIDPDITVAYGAASVID